MGGWGGLRRLEEVAPPTSQPPLTSPNLPNLLQPYLTSVLPYKDENPTELTPVITLGIIVLNVLAWLFVQGAGAAEPLARSVCQLGLIPGEVLHTVPPGTAVPLGEGLRCVLTADARSEEHTSELQSLAYLVCRLLLEKKKTRDVADGYWCRLETPQL